MNNEPDMRSDILPTSLFTIIVPCRNEELYIAKFLDNLANQSGFTGPLEILIADGMSNDRTREIIDSYRDQLTGLRVLDNVKKFVSSGLNQCIAVASGRFIIRMDVHTTYDSTYCRNCLRVIDETKAANVGGAARTLSMGYIADVISAAYGSRFAVGGANFHFPEYEGEVDTVPYGCWEKDYIVSIGLFDESFVRNQDDELNLRIRRSGGRIWQSAAILSWYHPRGNFVQLYRQYFQYGFWKVAVIRKHKMPASLRHLVPAAFVLSGAGSLVAALFSSWGLFVFSSWLLGYMLFLVAGSIHKIGRAHV